MWKILQDLGSGETGAFYSRQSIPVALGAPVASVTQETAAPMASNEILEICRVNVALAGMQS